MTPEQIHSVTTVGLVLAIIVLLSALAFSTKIGMSIVQHFKRRPLSSFTKDQLDNVFNLSPELKAKYTARGTMSLYEYRQALHTNLARIKAELARRKGV